MRVTVPDRAYGMLSAAIEDGPLFEAGVRVVATRRYGRGRQVILSAPDRAAVIAIVGELLYVWEERSGYDPELRPEATAAGRAGERIAREYGVTPDELPSYCDSEARWRIR